MEKISSEEGHKVSIPAIHAESDMMNPMASERVTGNGAAIQTQGSFTVDVPLSKTQMKKAKKKAEKAERRQSAREREREAAEATVL